MSRKSKLLEALNKQYKEEIDDRYEILIEERPDMWKRAGITKARPNLKEAKKQNTKNLESIQKKLELIILGKKDMDIEDVFGS